MPKEPKILHTVAEWRASRAEFLAKTPNATLGVVPTMGALHAGHASLFAAARRDCDLVLATLFVNPTQFDDPSDLARYPRTLDADLALMAEQGVDAALIPPVEELYPPDTGTHYTVQEDHFSRTLCGTHRPGHFTGVLTVVMKLLQIAGATRAYFGEKDWQQLQLIKGMATAFFLETEIIGCPSVRGPDGLALSSRNRHLSPAERALAPQFYKTLCTAPDAASATAQLTALGFAVDYVEDLKAHQRRLSAIRLGNTRLIDNVPLS
ncbi:pantoate--beta-alanine ligase [Cephaloticoccus capnophilus]|uniref:pantoate--beta-alanine ligase n=1 Tax=Cephaloticoccus capnophilus TaxID=1548208 RepID=UPI0008388F8A|nr:pantoate--beta-alanine ligase [Cephaloticoccus capnophilus]